MGPHLFVFIHGLAGSPHDFDNMEVVFAQRPEVLTLKVVSNAGLGRTLDGVEKGAVRVWREVIEFEKTNEFTHVSIVGHSLGGLYARFAIRLLADCDFFQRHEPVFFITLATPHLGVRRPPRSLFNYAFLNFVKIAGDHVSLTAQELSLEDPSPQLLLRMTEDSFLKSLALFSRRILYANVMNDFQVIHSTASILPRTPYFKTPGAPTTTSPQFPSLTKWSLENAHREIAQDEIEDFALSDVRRGELRMMLVSLNSLRWERFDAVFLSLFAHEQIINKRFLFSGKDVTLHLASIL